VNPKTGMALTGRRSVTVTAARDITADCYATAICVLGHERGLRLIAETSGRAAFIMEEESGQIRQYHSSGFPQLQPASAWHRLPSDASKLESRGLEGRATR
jgi:thiamine biosynthesis lipoprotein